MIVSLPIPPSTNALYRNTSNGRAMTKAYKAWKLEAGWMLRSQTWEKVPGPVWLSFSIPKGRADIDNLLKAPIDLLVSHKVIDDDRNVAGITAAFVEGLPSMRIFVEPAEKRAEAI